MYQRTHFARQCSVAANESFYAVWTRRPSGDLFLDSNGFITGLAGSAARFQDVNLARAEIPNVRKNPGAADWDWKIGHVHLLEDGLWNVHEWLA
jgi:hypothetical protein